MLWFGISPYKLGVFKNPTKLPTDIREDVILVSLGSAGFISTARAIPTLHAGAFENSLALETPYRSGADKPQVPRHITFHVIESPKQLAHLPEILRERFSQRLAGPAAASVSRS